jgi:GT2 family glycosyltransferase
MSHAAEIRISVIVPTLNRKHYLPQLVESLTAQTLPKDEFEVIIVDNCSSDGSDELMREYARTSPFRLVYHRNNANLGVSKSRNIGARMAQSQLLAFTDSDCIASPQWLEEGIRAMQENPVAALVTGPVLNKPEARSRFFSIGESTIRSENPFFPTCNIVYRRELFFAFGGFREDFYFFDLFQAPLECGDIDLGWRIKEAGHQSVFASAATMYHEIRLVSPLEWLASFVRVIWVPQMARLHPGFKKKLVWWGPFVLRDNFLFYLAIIGIALGTVLTPSILILSAAFWIRLVNIVNPKPSPVGVVLLFPKMFFLVVRQTVICSALIYGSIRARCLVL